MANPRRARRRQRLGSRHGRSGRQGVADPGRLRRERGQGRRRARVPAACRSCRRTTPTRATGACNAPCSTCKSDGGREAFLSLAAETDVLIESFRPGVVDRLGHRLRRASAPRNPGIILLLHLGLRPERTAQRLGRPRRQLPGRRGFLDCIGPPGRRASGTARRHRRRHRRGWDAGGDGDHGCAAAAANAPEPGSTSTSPSPTAPSP